MSKVFESIQIQALLAVLNNDMPTIAELLTMLSDEELAVFKEDVLLLLRTIEDFENEQK